jgi:predicted O-methyltransferase YrrM
MRRKMPMSERLFRRFFYKYWARYLLIDLQLIAKRETLDYIQAKMRDALLFEDRWDVLSYAVEQATLPGLYLEFGVEKGASINWMAQRTDRIINGFDSFEGLPEDWAGTFERRGKFSRRGQVPKVAPNVRLHTGWFDKTLPEFLRGTSENVALLHVDCDIYSSTKTIFDLLGDRLRPGTVIVFDEYFNYPNWQKHEFRAFQEFVGRTGLAYDYAGFCVKDGHVVTKVR